MLDKMAGMVNEAKRSLAFVVERREAVKELLAGNFSSGALAHLGDRQLLVPESVIWREIQTVPEVRSLVTSIRCHANGIDLETRSVKLGGTIDTTARLYLRDVTIGEARQEMIAEIADESVQGASFWGKIVVGIGRVFVDNFIRQAIRKSSLADQVEYLDDQTIRVSLANLPAVRKLREKKIPAWEDSIPLRLVSVSGAVHVEQGVKLQLEVADAVDIVQTGIADLLRAGKRKLNDIPGWKRSE